MYEDFGGIIGVVVAWVVFPITLIVSPIYGVLAHGDWLGVLLVALGPVTYLLLGLVAASGIGDIDRQLGQISTPQDDRGPSSPQPSDLTSARQPYRDQIDELATTHPHAAESLRGVRDQAHEFFLDTNVWLAAGAIWTIVQAAWLEDRADAFFAARDEAQRRLDEDDPEVGRVADAIVRDISDLASTAIRNSAMIGSGHLGFDAQNRADDRAMWQAGGAHHVVKAAVLGFVAGDKLDERMSSLLTLPWRASCATTEEDRYELIAAAEENTLEAFQAVADDRGLLQEPDQPRSALVELLELIDGDLEDDDPTDDDEDDGPVEDDASLDDELDRLFGPR